MYKTVFAVRFAPDDGRAYVDMGQTALWPPDGTPEFLEATAILQGLAYDPDRDFCTALASAGYEDAAALVRSMPGMKMRARFNNLKVWVINTEEAPDDTFLLHVFKQRKQLNLERLC